MRQSASTHSLIPIRTNAEFNIAGQRKGDAPSYQSRLPSASVVVPHVSSKVNRRPIMATSPERGLGISVSPSRVPVRAANSSVFANATMVQGRDSQNSNINTNMTPKARAQINPHTKLSEPFRTPVLGSDDHAGTPSPTYSTSISPSFIVRNLDEDPHTGSTPTTQTFDIKKVTRQTSRLSKTIQLPSPPSSPASPKTSRIPRRSKDDITLTESSRKLQIASSKPRRISIPSGITLDTLAKSGPEMTVALAPPAPITIPPNEYANGYLNDKPLPSAKSPGTLASFFRWNAVPPEPVPDRLQTPSTLSSHPTSPMTPTSPSISALEQELKSVSEDLAFSIRREMDLEDVITRLQDEIVRLGGEGKRQIRFRSSDYFSENSFRGDSGEDEPKERGHSRMSSVAVEDVRMANEKVTQLEKEVLRLKSENLELMTAKREAEKKVNDERRSVRYSKKVHELEVTVEQLRGELIEKTRTIESLQQTINRNKGGNSDQSEEIKALTERAKGAESQRQALQLALRQLRERQTLEAKKAADRIKQLEVAAEREKTQRFLPPRTPDRAVTGITHRTPDNVKRKTITGNQDQEAKIVQLRNDLSASSKKIASLTITNTQLSNENTQLRDLQQRLQLRLTQLEASASASTIGEASATASLSYAHRLAVEMARVTDIHVKSLEKVRNTANATLPNLKMGAPLSPLLKSAYDASFSPKRLSIRSPRLGEDVTVKMMENRIKELESALHESSEEMGEVVRKMQMAQIEMIELAGERDEAVRRERKLKMESENEIDNGLVKSENNEVQNLGIPV